MHIYAHRGASADFPELTLAAFEGAIKQGADGVECDLRITKDEVPVLWHNSSMIERAGNKGLISEMTFKEVSQAYPQVMTLDQILDFSLFHSVGLLIETKHPVISGNRVEEILAKTLKQRKIAAKIPLTVMSFSWSAIEKLKRISPEIPTALLLHKHTPWFQIKYSSASFIGPEIEHIRVEQIRVKRIQELGRPVIIWTVDEDSDMELCEKLGVDILVTNKPARAREVLRYP